MQKQLLSLINSVANDRAVQGLNVYVVGGAVRDTLLGLPVGDRDWVVVGATPQDMVKRKFVPLGSQFPVFLHPVTREEYALARTERKSGIGYKGFTFYTGLDITIEQDLLRRDLTVNAIALDKLGNLIDPYNGLVDIEKRIFRHVGDAFIEDPVRLLRLARFMARFADFTIATETIELAKHLVQSGEVDALVPERVWQEITKGLMSSRPDRMFETLQITGAINKVISGLNWQQNISPKELICVVKENLPLPSRFAILTRLSTNQHDVSVKIRASNDCKDYAILLPVVIDFLQENSTYKAQDLLKILISVDAIRKPGRFMDLIAASNCTLPLFNKLDVDFWLHIIQAVNSIDSAAIAKAAQGDVDKIKDDIYCARLKALQQIISKA